MEGFEVGKRDENICMIKKRRTKRPRHDHETTSSSLSSFSDNNSGGFDRRYSPVSNDYDNIELSHKRVEEEEKDMAKCLMLLSQGHVKKPPSPATAEAAAPSSPPYAAAGNNKEVYECKTCSRVFPSFQALGGHRASHRKPKSPENQESVDVDDVTRLSLKIPGRVVISHPPPRNKSTRIHECSICGAEFSSGQALGGHMRRHRPLPITAGANSGSREESSSDQEIKKPRHPLALDLNLPAPEDDHREITKFSFSSKEQVIVFSASPLVDCHY